MQVFLLKGLTVDCTRLGSANTLFDQHFTAKKDLRSPLTNASNVAVPPFMGYIRNVISVSSMMEHYEVFFWIFSQISSVHLTFHLRLHQGVLA